MITDEQRTITAELVADEWGGDVAEYVDNIGATRDSMDHYRGATWSDCGAIDETEVAGYPALIIHDAQAIKGQPRVDVCVVDFGHIRTIFQQ